MFTQVSPPLMHAEAMLTQLIKLSRATDDAVLMTDFARGFAEISGCELTQVYLLDAAHLSLTMVAECLDGDLQPRTSSPVPADYTGDQLLQYVLCQSRAVFLNELSCSVHETSFLPPQALPWQSLLCVPLISRHESVEGLLLCASRRHIDLQALTRPAGELGSFVLGQSRLLRRLRKPASEVRPVAGVPSAADYGLIGTSPAVRKICSLISKVLHSPYTVLLSGETGTGKEVVARAIHECGPRRSKAFIVQNCAALPEHLLESELFGYRKGAFTGADVDRAGLFDAANGGTLMLDEVGDMPLLLQAKLLRVLQEGEIRPLGSIKTHKIDVRILAATHRDLAVMVSEGRFREDLYYRLAQFPIELPPLRQREGDILELARHFAEKTCTFLQRDPVRWSDAALGHLSGYAFPGNVRELKGLVECAVLLCEGGELLPAHFSLRIEPMAEPVDGLSLRERLEQVERVLLIDCLRKNDGNQTLAARELGLPRRTLLYRLARLNLTLETSDD